MKKVFCFISVVTALSCNNHKPDENVIYLSVASPEIKIRQDVVYRNGFPFTGTLYELRPETGDTLFRAGYRDGVLHGRLQKWYASGQRMEERFYSAGQKHGKQSAWWENGNPKFRFTARADAYEGELKEWTFDGKLIHLANFKAGQEEGVQKLWYDNGKIRANYVMTNGRRYGLLGTKNCKNVSDSIFVVR